jgi:biopolymer transport protein ExbD
MADIDVAGGAAARKEGEINIRRPKKRTGVRIDMTPMVDVAFLLLIFFMVTTVFRQPLAMEVNMPEPDASVKVPEENVMTLTIDRENTLSYKMGTGPVAPLAWNRLYQTFRDLGQQNAELIVLVKIHREANYESMVEMMDTLEDAEMDRFSVVPLKDAEPPPAEGR